jgi:NAD(P)-dependent dehydrogenase (short-subunit alcohol dehydrogenase family)
MAKLKNLGDSVIVITGASSGIGRATALHFARHGATIALLGRREEALEELAQDCDRLGGHAYPMKTDVTDEEAVRAAARRAVESFGRIDVWVNNAGITLFARLEEAPMEDFRRVIDTNLFGYIHGARAVIPYFREQGRGTLINVGSFVGKIGSPYVSAYSISKFGILGLGESLRMELMDAPGIDVSTILPGSIDTPLFQHAANYTGRAIKPINPVYPAEQVARAIVSCAQRPRREVVPGGAPKQMLLLHGLAPALAERMMSSQVEHDHFQDRPAEETSGNLFEPMDHYRTVSGGWRTSDASSGGGAAVIGAAIVALGVIGMGLRYWLNERQRPSNRAKRMYRHASDKVHHGAQASRSYFNQGAKSTERTWDALKKRVAALV